MFLFYLAFFVEKTILSIYQENNIFSSFDKLKESNAIVEEKEDILKTFLNLKLKEVYQYYLNSKIK